MPIDMGGYEGEAVDERFKKSEEVQAVNLDELPKHNHNWIKRGIKISCEGAGHPHHSHFLTKRSR